MNTSAEAIYNKCRLQIGEFCCALEFNADREYQQSVKKYFEHFLCEKEPDITVIIEIILHQEIISAPTSLFNAKTIVGNHFNFNDGLIVGWLDLANKHCSIEVKNALFSNPTVRIFEQFLYQLYYTLLENKYGNKKVSKFLLHSSGVVKDGMGYLFVGPSGSGKSTVAQLSTMYDIVNDEICLIERADNEYILHATPFNGYFHMKRNISAPLKKIFILKQDSRHYVRRIGRADYIVPLFREMVTPIGILSPNSIYALPYQFDCVIQLLEKVDCYELHFLPDNNFWRYIEELE